MRVGPWGGCSFVFLVGDWHAVVGDGKVLDYDCPTTLKGSWSGLPTCANFVERGIIPKEGNITQRDSQVGCVSGRSGPFVWSVTPKSVGWLHLPVKM